MGPTIQWCLFFGLLALVSSEQSLSSSEDDDSTNTKPIHVLSLAKARVEDIQKMFGDVAEKLDENAADALRKFRDGSRSKRHDGRRGKKGSGSIFGKRMCCDFPDYLANKQFVRTCHQEFINKNLTRGSSKEENQKVSKCFMECIAKKKGWTNEDGTINKEIVTTSMISANKTNEWNPIVVEAQEQCFAELKPSENTDGCSADSQQFLYCIFEHHFLNCPASAWRDSEKCRAAEALISAVAVKRQRRAALMEINEQE